MYAGGAPAPCTYDTTCSAQGSDARPDPQHPPITTTTNARLMWSTSGRDPTGSRPFVLMRAGRSPRFTPPRRVGCSEEPRHRERTPRPSPEPRCAGAAWSWAAGSPAVHSRRQVFRLGARGPGLPIGFPTVAALGPRQSPLTAARPRWSFTTLPFSAPRAVALGAPTTGAEYPPRRRCQLAVGPPASGARVQERAGHQPVLRPVVHRELPARILAEDRGPVGPVLPHGVHRHVELGPALVIEQTGQFGLVRDLLQD